MNQEQQLFDEIQTQLIELMPGVSSGRMMSSPAITYNRKVFAFLSRSYKMVFKLGKGFDPGAHSFDIQPFNPFVKKGPLPGWFEVPYSNGEHWAALAEQALTNLKT